MNAVCVCTQLCPILCDPMDFSPLGLCPWNFPSRNTGMGCHFLLQGIFPTQGSNPRLLNLLHCRQILSPLGHLGNAVETLIHQRGLQLVSEPHLRKKFLFHYCLIDSVQFSSVPQSCPTLCNPMDCSTSGLPVHLQLPEVTQTHVH